MFLNNKFKSGPYVFSWIRREKRFAEEECCRPNKKKNRSAGASRSAVVKVCPSSLRSSDWIVYYYYIRFECNNCIRKKNESEQSFGKIIKKKNLPISIIFGI